MKKDRNTFFQESQSFMGQFPNQNYNMAQPFNYQQSSYYAGSGVMPNNYNTTSQSNSDYLYSDMDSRISKIERQINRLEARLKNLESQTFYTNEEIDTTTNMYMV